MNTNRRQFIKTAGKGIAGISFASFGVGQALGGVGNAGVKGAAAGGGMGAGISGAGGSGELFGQESGLPEELLGEGFRRATPESQGVSSRSIRDFLAAANASGISWHSMMLVRHGQVVAEGWWKPYGPGFVHSLYSLSKSFTSTAIGLLVKEGKLDIHAKLVAFFPDDLPAVVSDNLKEVTVRSLLTMNTGHAEDTLPKMRAGSASWVRTYLAQPVEYAPGTHFMYNTGNTYMLGAILYKVTGQTLEDYLRPRLFQPLGITGYDWEVSPQGLNTAGYGLRVKTEDIAKLGQLYLQKGKWKGQDILTEQWVDEATSKQTESQVNNGDWSQGYGYQFWRCTHGFYRGDGAFGQFCIVMPQHDAVLAITGQSADMQKSMNIIWDHLPGGMHEGVLPENKEEEASLKKELSLLELSVEDGGISVLPGVKRGGGGSLAERGGGAVPAAAYDKKKFIMAENPYGIRELWFDFSEKDCTLNVMKDGRPNVMKFGWERWMLDGPRKSYVFGVPEMTPMPSRMAGTARWMDGHVLRLNLRFVEAIFGDAITCRFEGNRLKIELLNSMDEMRKTVDPRKGLEGRMG